MQSTRPCFNKWLGAGYQGGGRPVRLPGAGVADARETDQPGLFGQATPSGLMPHLPVRPNRQRVEWPNF
jgi:hypothetical protein